MKKIFKNCVQNDDLNCADCSDFENCVQNDDLNCADCSDFENCLMLKALENLKIDPKPIMREIGRLRWQIEKETNR